jgi:hypothetical protein
MDHLGRDVLGGAAHGVGLDGVAGFVIPEPHGEAKVDQLDVALGVEQQVLGLQVPVGDAALLLVQVLEDQHDLGGVEAGRVLVEAAELAHVGEELAAGHVVEEEIEKVVIGEGREEVGDKGVAPYVGQYLALVTHMIELLLLDHCGRVLVFHAPSAPTRAPGERKPTLGFAEDLERIHLAAVSLGAVGRPDETDAGEGP